MNRDRSIETGLLCPECGEATVFAIHGAKVLDATVIRTRWCKSCGKRWKTMEVAIPWDADNKARVWRDIIIAEMKDLWALGIPAEEIGRRIGKSKRAVIGKADRLDLPQHVLYNRGN